MHSRSSALRAAVQNTSRETLDGIDLSSLALDDLPPPETKRWVIRRKALVVAGVKSGLLTAQQACARYNLSEEELEGWTKLVERHGMKGLRATRIQRYRIREV